MVRNPPPSSPQKQCKRLWCTSAEGDHKGCRTQHMPLADGTDCGHGMVCLSTLSRQNIYKRCNLVQNTLFTAVKTFLGGLWGL